MDLDKVIALAKSTDVSSVLLAFELNESLKLDSQLTMIDEKMQELANKTIMIQVNRNRIFVTEDQRVIEQEEADEMREILMDLNPNFYKFPFMEEFLSKRYQVNIVFSF
jgi:hypothetical protein